MSEGQNISQMTIVIPDKITVPMLREEADKFVWEGIQIMQGLMRKGNADTKIKAFKAVIDLGKYLEQRDANQKSKKKDMNFGGLALGKNVTNN